MGANDVYGLFNDEGRETWEQYKERRIRLAVALREAAVAMESLSRALNEGPDTGTWSATEAGVASSEILDFDESIEMKERWTRLYEAIGEFDDR